jgi:hypothetical protein
MSIAMKRKSCVTMTPSFCCSVLPKIVCHFALENDVMEGTFLCDGNHNLAGEVGVKREPHWVQGSS